MKEESWILVNRAKKNDLEAFEELVRLHQNKVYALCRQLCGNSDEAQDIAQEAFIRAYKAIDRFRNEADFGTWLHRITVNVWLNVCRRKNGQGVIVSLDETYQDTEGSGGARHEVADQSADPQEALETNELRDLVRTALMNLSEEHRAVLVLREIEGYSYEEVARMLGCSLGTVKSRLSRAREAMKRRVNELARESKEA